MPVAGSLATLMKEWPLNSVTLSTATHNKLREALDGTDTQVATCIINRWTAKMKGAKGCITREISRRGGIAVQKTPEISSRVVSEEEKKNSSSDETRGQTFTPPLPFWWSCSLTIRPTIDEVLAKAQFLSPPLYQIHCIGPVGFEFAHIYSEGSLKSGPYMSLFFIYNYYFENLIYKWIKQFENQHESGPILWAMFWWKLELYFYRIVL